MLSAFKAQPIIELKQRDKSRIESVLLYDARLLVGLNTGSLRVYRVNEVKDDTAPEGEGADEQRPTSKSGPRHVDLLREEEKFSKHKIEQLALVKEANVLLSLSNSYIHLHDLQEYKLQNTLTRSKGASIFAMTSNVNNGTLPNAKPTITRVAVAVKRKLLIWTWLDGELEDAPFEIALFTGIKSLTWATATRLVAGLNANYVLVDTDSSAITDIVGPGAIGGAPGQDGGRFGASGVAGMGYLGLSAPKPLATKLGEKELLLAKDINTHFIDTDGSSLGRRQIPWPVAPEAIGYSHPYIASLQSGKGTLELRNPETLTMLQSIALPSAQRLHILRSGVSLAHDLKGFLVLSERCIWRMQAQDYDMQIDQIVEKGRLDEAISLMAMLEDSLLKDRAGRTREIKMEKAQLLFDVRKFRDSIDLFTEVSAPPERVISLYPTFIAGPLSRDHGGKDLDGGDSLDAKAQVSGDHGQERSKGGSEQHDTNSQQALKNGQSATDGEEVVQEGNRSPLEGKTLKLATEELRGFLVSARTKIKKVLNTDGTLKTDSLDEVPNPELGFLLSKTSFNASEDHGLLLDIARLVDTTLFRAYMFVSPSFAGPLFRIDNFCDPEVVNEKLIEAGRYNDLVDFFYGKKLHRQALELLERFGNKEPSEAAPQLTGPQRTVAYLQNLPPNMINLILEFSPWPLKNDPELAMEIFLGDTENAETLPRQAVLDFLHGIDSKLALRYLEHIIHELNDTTPSFHQRLVDVYIQGIKSDDFPSATDRRAWKEKSLTFLRTSKNYQAYQALLQLPPENPSLYELRAIVLSNIGQHKQALEIYVFKLQDAEKAEEYCNQIYLSSTASPDAPVGPQAAPSAGFGGRRRSSVTPDDPEEGGPVAIYTTLLSLYLSPPPPHEPQWAPALALLAKHGSRMPASSTLDLIPQVLPVKELEAYFQGQIRSAKTRGNEARVVAGLRSSLALREEARLRLGEGGESRGRARRVVIGEERVCGVCFKRFGGSAVKVLPDNSVVHYGCSAL